MAEWKKEKKNSSVWNTSAHRQTRFFPLLKSNRWLQKVFSSYVHIAAASSSSLAIANSNFTLYVPIVCQYRSYIVCVCILIRYAMFFFPCCVTGFFRFLSPTPSKF